MSDYTMLSIKDFYFDVAELKGLNRSGENQRLSPDQIAAEIKASAQLNPPRPYVRTPFDPAFFGLYKKS
jgi:hypothetical protein